MIGILQRYTLREILGPALLGLMVFTFLLLVAEIFKMMDLLVNTSVSIWEALEIILCVIPTLLPVTVPMSLLLGVLLGFGRMASDNEIIAIRSSGIRLWRIVWPVIALCAVISAVMIWTNQRLAPSLSLRAADTGLKVLFKLASALEPGRVHTELGQDDTEAALYFRQRRPDGALQGVAMKLGNSEKSTLKENEVFISAPRGEIQPDIEGVTIRFTLEDGVCHIRSTDRPSDYSVIDFQSLERVFRVDIGRRSDTGEFRKKAKMMTVPELRDHIERPWIKERYRNTYRVELARRFSVPLACVTVILLGIPLAIRIRPSANSMGFAIALALIFAYYVLLEWGSSLGLSGSPWGTPMIFMPNVLLGGLGAVLMVKTLNQ